MKTAIHRLRSIIVFDIIWCVLKEDCAMKRTIYDILLNWKRTSAGKSAIMIDGARRVGKSYIAEKFAKAEYAAYLIIDFATASRKVKSVSRSSR